MYLKNIKFLSEIITYENPDVIINFCDFLVGIYNFWFRPKLKFICIGHHYLISHPEFTSPNKKTMSRVIFKLANQIARLRAAKVLALSFQYFKNSMTNNFIVTPPLLRKELLELKIKTEDYFLIYIVNSGYGENIEFFLRKNPNIPLICFWDNKEKLNRYVVSENLIFYQVNDQLFLEKIAACKGFVTTADFDSVCESIYLGKPTLMIPVEGHHEQECNALDAFKAGAGITRSNFDLTPLLNYIPKYKNMKNEFHRWVAQEKHIFMKNLN